MRIDDLRRVLRGCGVLGEVGGEPTPGELADILWLAALRREGLPVSAPAEDGIGRTGDPGASKGPAPEHLPSSAPEPDHLLSNSAAYASLPTRAGALSGVLVSAAGAMQLPEALPLARAMRPLRRRVPSATRRVLDEEATADLRAEQQLWLPALIPDTEPAFDLALVIDDSESMALWSEKVREFRLLCERIGAFRDVRPWRLGARGGGSHARPVLRSSRSTGTRDQRELVDLSGRRLILVITDGLNPWWRTSGPLLPVLARWALTSPLAIVQPFPQRLWERSPLRPVTEKFRPGWPGNGPTITRHARNGHVGGKVIQGSVTVPILELSPAALQCWAGIISGTSGVTRMPAVILPRENVTEEGPPGDDRSGTGESRDWTDPARLVREFRATVSPAAYQLAGYLSAAPLTLPVMRLVQESMMPATGPAELAEVFLSGLLLRSASTDPLADPERTSYVFAAGVRDALQSTLTRSEALSVLDQVGRYLTGGRRGGRPFPVLLRDQPDGSGILAAAEQFPESFGRISGRLLERIYAPYTAAARLDAEETLSHVRAAGHEPVVALATEEALRRSEERYRALVQGGAQVIWVASPDGEMLEDSAEWRWITGQTVQEFLGKGWIDSIHLEDRERVERDWQDCLRTGRIFDERFRVRTRDGSYRHYDVRAVPIERDGTIAEWAGVCTDVTSQREAEELRGRLTEQLSASALRTARLQQATAMLAEALDVEQVVAVITELGRTAIGALRSAVALLDDDQLGLRVVNPDGLAPVGPDAANVRLTLNTPSVMTRAIATRRPVLIADPEELRKQFDADSGESAGRVLDTGDEQAWVGLPLLAAGMPLGALRFSFGRPRKMSGEEQVFLEALAGQCALAVERAEMYEKEHTAAVTLQRSLLPGDLPRVPGLVLDAVYLPRSTEVGGDWYDVFRLADQRLAIIVGDVMGKGLLAAAGMGRVRSALRSLALTDPRPAAVLAGLDRLFTATELEEQITTVTYLVINPETGEGQAGNAGHPPTLLLTPGSPPVLDGAEADTPLGWAGPRRQHAFRLPRGSTAVFYSDGLVKNRIRGLDSGLDELVSIAAGVPQELHGAPGQLLQYLLDNMLAGHEQDDDVTMLVVHRPEISVDAFGGLPPEDEPTIRA